MTGSFVIIAIIEISEITLLLYKTSYCTLGIWSPRATKMVPGESWLWAPFGALFASFRSSPTRPYIKRVYSVSSAGKGGMSPGA